MPSPTSLHVAPGASFEAVATGVLTGLTGALTVRIIDNVGGTFLAATTSGIAERVTANGYGVYAVTLTAPTTRGQYTILWNDGVNPLFGQDLVVDYTASEAGDPDGIDLTTVAAVRDYLQKPGADTAQDAIIQTLITEASRMILRYTERELAPATASATRRFILNPQRRVRVNGLDSYLVDLNPYDLRTASSVQLNPEAASPTTLTASSDYLLHPHATRHGVYTHLLVSRSVALGSTLQSRFGFSYVDIAGAWGFASVPEDVARACKVCVGIWMRREVQAFSATFNLDEGRVERPEALPTAVQRALFDFKRPGVA